MTMARAHLVDPTVTRWYHCVTRCVRRAFLLSEGPINRREWIERRAGNGSRHHHRRLFGDGQSPARPACR